MFYKIHAVNYYTEYLLYFSFVCFFLIYNLFFFIEMFKKFDAKEDVSGTQQLKSSVQVIF